MCACVLQTSKDRLQQVRDEIAQLQEKLRPLEMRYEKEKKRLEQLHALQKKKEELEIKLQQAEIRMDLAMVADIKCAPKPTLTLIKRVMCRRAARVVAYAFTLTQLSNSIMMLACLKEIFLVILK